MVLIDHKLRRKVEKMSQLYVGQVEVFVLGEDDCFVNHMTFCCMVRDGKKPIPLEVYIDEYHLRVCQGKETYLILPTCNVGRVEMESAETQQEFEDIFAAIREIDDSCVDNSENMFT